MDRLLNAINIPHLHYDLIHAKIVIDGIEYETYLNKSVDYKKKGEKKTAFDSFYMVNRKANESPLDFAIRNGWEEYLYQMFIVDYLIILKSIINKLSVLFISVLKFQSDIISEDEFRKAYRTFKYDIIEDKTDLENKLNIKL